MQRRHRADIALISIHAAREGGDHVRPIRRPSSDPLPSTPPVKAATDAVLYRPLVGAFQSTPPVKAATAETYKCNQHSRKQQV